MKKAALVLFAILLLLNLGESSIALAWNPTASDLTGTGSSTDNSIADTLKRLDIDHTTAGIQTGEDADSLAFSIKLMARSYDSSAAANDVPANIVVVNQPNAYDGNLGTSANFTYDVNNGLFKITTFGTSTGTITSVDLYVHCEVQGTTGGDTYFLTYQVTPSATDTELWAASGSAKPLGTYDFLSLVEPNNGTWEWADVQNFQLNWQCDKSAAADGMYVYVYEVWLQVNGYGFDATAMTADDQYEIDFTIGEEDFAMLFQATGAAAGTMKLFYRATGEGAWSSGDSVTVGTIVSGTAYQSVSTDIGFTLTSSTASTGFVKFVVTKNILATLGATANVATGIFAANFAGGTGEAGSGGATPNDRSPSTDGAAWTLSEAIPDFPFGTLILVLPVMSIYLILRRQQNNERKSHFHILPENMMTSSRLQYLLVIALLATIAYSFQRQTSVLIEEEEVEAGLIESGDRPALYFKLRNTGDDLAYYTYSVTCTYMRAVTDSSTGEVTRETSSVVVSPGQAFSYSMGLANPDQDVLDLNLKIFRGVQLGGKLLRDQSWVIESK